MAKPSTLKNLVLTLLIITFLSALGLGGLNHLTQEPIQQAKTQKILEALKDVLPPFDNDPSAEQTEFVFKTGPDSGEVVNLYNATKGSEWVGTAIKTFSKKGFGGRVTIMVGFDKEGKISGYSVLEHTETPGLGDHMVDWFKPPVAPVPSLVERVFRFEMKASPKNSNVYGVSPSDQPKDELKVTKDGGTIDAITAATISSRAFLDAINRAYSVFKGTDNYTGATSSSTENQEEK